MQKDMAEERVELTATEKAALAIGRLANETEGGKLAQYLFHKGFTRRWVAKTVMNRTYVEGIDYLVDMEPDRGVMIVSNHRSFFDQYVQMLAFFTVGIPWVRRIMFPVRSNFFYDHPIGVFLNYAVGAGTMYPPIFRQRTRAEQNKEALDRIIEHLKTRKTVVGVHPEGTRGKGPDPYEMLPAQPGVGQMVLHGKPIVVPIWMNGLGNNFVADVKSNYVAGIRQRNPVIMIVGQPIDYSEFTQKKPRAALYKRCADKLRDEILALAPREKELRAMCARGEIPNDDPNWLANRARA
jgi:1-acyl-sn-glycerol-3-phosphate acyltransferase